MARLRPVSRRRLVDAGLAPAAPRWTDAELLSRLDDAEAGDDMTRRLTVGPTFDELVGLSPSDRLVGLPGARS